MPIEMEPNERKVRENSNAKKLNIDIVDESNITESARKMYMRSGLMEGFDREQTQDDKNKENEP